MTHPDTLQIDRAVEPEWGPQQAYAEGRSAYENSMLPNTTSAVRFNELSSSEQAFWVAHAAFRAALQPQDAVTTSGPPERDNSKPAEQQGVFRKFNVQRTDGSDQPGGKHHECEYFVLDVAHDQHAKPALEAYAVACATTHPQLSADMRERYGLQAQAAAEPVTDAPDLPEPVGVVLGFEDDSGMAMVDHASEGGQTLEEKQCVYSGDQMEQRWVQGFLAGKSHTTPPTTQAEAEQHTFNDESPFCVKCGSTGEDAEGPVAHILPRDLKILKFKSMPVPVDPLPYDNGEEKTVPLYTSPPATQAALTAASDCRTCQHLSEAWGVCEARPKCVGGEQYVYFPEKQLWDKTPRNDGQAAHQEMREALYAEFNSAVGRQHD